MIGMDKVPNIRGKICHLTSVHPSTDTRIFLKQCCSLARAGYTVSYVVPHDRTEMLDGVRVVGIPKAQGGRLARMTLTVWRVFRAAVLEDAAIYHFHDPELIPVGILLRLKGKKVIYDVHEDLPRLILSKSWISPWLRYPISWISEMVELGSVNLFFSGVVAATPTIAQRFPASKTVTVHNFPILNELICKKQMNYTVRPKRVVYIGDLDRVRGTIENIKSITHVRDKECKLVLAGNFSPPALENECRKLDGWSYVDFKGCLNRSQVADILNYSRVGLVLLHPIINYLDSYPVKLFEYMSAGIPVIASDFPLWRKIIKSADCGLLVDPMDPVAIAEAIDWILEHPTEAAIMGERGRRAVLEKYNWEKEIEKLIRLYKELLS